MGNLENIRPGAPYSDPTFETLCRAHDIWGTEEAALCAAFWETAKRQQQTLSTHESLAQRLREHAASAEPSGYAYRYPDGIRFNDGREVNGCKPTETLPYWFGAAPVAQEPVARDWPSIQSAIDEYLDGYELIGEPGDHTPTEFEKFLLTDAIAGLLDDEKFLGLFAAPVAAKVPTIKESLKVVQAQHPDDVAVDQFAVAMKTKLAQKRAEGRGGWEDKAQCSQDRLSLMLRGHVAKGDPVDVANFAMMLHQRGERISGRDAASPSVQDQEDALLDHVRDMLSGALIATGPAQAIMVADVIKDIDAARAVKGTDHA